VALARLSACRECGNDVLGLLPHVPRVDAKVERCHVQSEHFDP